jgi:hypothetical protein
VASLEAAHQEGLRDGFATVDEVEARLREALAAARKQRA